MFYVIYSLNERLWLKVKNEFWWLQITDFRFIKFWTGTGSALTINCTIHYWTRSICFVCTKSNSCKNLMTKMLFTIFWQFWHSLCLSCWKLRLVQVWIQKSNFPQSKRFTLLEYPCSLMCGLLIDIQDYQISIPFKRQYQGLVVYRVYLIE